jgi:hypothetical protein
LDSGNEAQAVKWAKKAYEIAWCDGPPFAYEHGLKKATDFLASLGDSPPNMSSIRQKVKMPPEINVEDIFDQIEEQKDKGFKDAVQDIKDLQRQLAELRTEITSVKQED